MPDIAPLLADLDGLAIDIQPQRVRRRSRDFYWYSPILKRELDHVTAAAVVTPKGEAEVLRVMRACWAHRVPLTVRGGGTGNYGQAMPLEGGLVMDLSEMTAIKEITLGRLRVEAGAKMSDIDASTQAHPLRQELRFQPGQFTMLYLFGVGEVPISICGDPAEPGTGSPAGAPSAPPAGGVAAQV